MDVVVLELSLYFYFNKEIALNVGELIPVSLVEDTPPTASIVYGLFIKMGRIFSRKAFLLFKVKEEMKT